MNTDLTFHRSGTGPADRRAGRVPSLPICAIHRPRQPAIPDEGRQQNNTGASQSPFMFTIRALKLSAPSLILIAAYLVVILAAQIARDIFIFIHFPLEVIIVVSWIAALIVLMRLKHKWIDLEVRLPMILNGLCVLAPFALALPYVFRN